MTNATGGVQADHAPHDIVGGLTGEIVHNRASVVAEPSSHTIVVGGDRYGSIRRIRVAVRIDDTQLQDVAGSAQRDVAVLRGNLRAARHEDLPGIRSIGESASTVVIGTGAE